MSLTKSRLHAWLCGVVCGAWLGGAVTSGGPAHAAVIKSPTGLAVTFKAGDQTDTTTAPGVALYVEAGKSPTPFLPGGKFTATWEGAVNADLRGNFSFQAELNGSLKIEINGAVIILAVGLDRWRQSRTRA